LVHGDGCALSAPVADALGVALSPSRWFSRLPDDEFAEYSDVMFIRQSGANLPKRRLADLWPRRGSMWNGLGRANRSHLLLVEAMAYICELVRAAELGSRLVV